MEKEDIEKEDMIFSDEEKATCRRNMAANIVSAILTLTGRRITVYFLISIRKLPIKSIVNFKKKQYWKRIHAMQNVHIISSSHI